MFLQLFPIISELTRVDSAFFDAHGSRHYCCITRSSADLYLSRILQDRPRRVLFAISAHRFAAHDWLSSFSAVQQRITARYGGSMIQKWALLAPTDWPVFAACISAKQLLEFLFRVCEESAGCCQRYRGIVAPYPMRARSWLWLPLMTSFLDRPSRRAFFNGFLVSRICIC